jgi:hypothetical protein
LPCRHGIPTYKGLSDPQQWPQTLRHMSLTND